MLDKLTDLKRKIFAPFVFRINPNYITIIAFIFALLAGYAFYKSTVLIATICVFITAFLDSLDGEIAKTYKRTSKFGDFLDHTLDRLADIAIFAGITLKHYVSDSIGFSAIIAILMVSYMGTQAQAITGKRLYAAVIGRADRLAILIFAGIINLFYDKALYYAVILILGLSVLTFVQRFYLTFRQLK